MMTIIHLIQCRTKSHLQNPSVQVGTVTGTKSQGETASDRVGMDRTVSLAPTLNPDLEQKG